ncbi:MAG: YiiD C-terminal domain-containing protein [Gammaproteobacteria bacterium]
MHAEFQELFDIWTNHIPLVNAMQLELRKDASDWYLTAPLEPNSNHMGTGFGGSLAAIATLAGWAQTYMLLTSPHEADIVVASSQVKYLKPAVATLIGTTDMPTDAEIEKFLNRYEKSNRAGITLTSRIHSNDVEAVTLRAKFVATRKQ